jgi:phosphatidate cytidylyltransferase
VGELKKRVAASLCLAPVIASVFYFLPAKWFFIALMVISIIALFELITMSGVKEKYLLLFLAMICVIPLYYKLFFFFTGCLLFSPFIFMGYKILKGESKKEGINEDILKGICVVFLCEVFVVIPVYYLYLLKETGRAFPFILLLAIWASDTCAYILGKRFGKRRLVPNISPKKTYEGLLGAMVGSTVVIVLSGKVLDMGILETVIVGAATGILAQMGDILESAGKRLCAAKDSSRLIPGHGGILDRMDSFIFTAPFLYHYLAGIKI